MYQDKRRALRNRHHCYSYWKYVNRFLFLWCYSFSSTHSTMKLYALCVHQQKEPKLKNRGRKSLKHTTDLILQIVSHNANDLLNMFTHQTLKRVWFFSGNTTHCIDTWFSNDWSIVPVRRTKFAVALTFSHCLRKWLCFMSIGSFTQGQKKKEKREMNRVTTERQKFTKSLGVCK